MPEPMVSADASIDEIREAFASDRFAATALSPVVEEARPGYSRVRVHIVENHLNGLGALMGGVSFTMGDFAFAIASNVGQPPTVSTNASIDFMGVPKTGDLVAECTVEKAGRTLCFATAKISDDAGNPVTRINFTGCRKG